jgi:hypothetical protein
MAPNRYRSIDEVTCGDYYEGFFLNSCKSGIGSYTYGTAKANYIGDRPAPLHTNTASNTTHICVFIVLIMTRRVCEQQVLRVWGLHFKKRKLPRTLLGRRKARPRCCGIQPHKRQHQRESVRWGVSERETARAGPAEFRQLQQVSKHRRTKFQPMFSCVFITS